jgi:hypothetical protein
VSAETGDLEPAQNIMLIGIGLGSNDACVPLTPT